MKKREEILEGHYTLPSKRGEVAFKNDTPRKLAEKLILLAEDKTRIVLDYGNVETKESWNEEYDVTGYVGFSRGYYDILWPILVFNSRSMGGTSILTTCILSIKESKGKRVIYSI